MNIVLYYWCPPNLSSVLRGGGVSVYLESLSKTLIDQGHCVSFVASGIDYSLFRKKPFYKKKILSVQGHRLACYSIVNSPVLAPGGLMGRNVRKAVTDQTSKDIFQEILGAIGSVDVVHFHSLEGLSFKVLELKQQLPKTRFIFSAHNYHALCPQVNLWQNDQSNCVDFEQGAACSTCLKSTAPAKLSIKKRQAFGVLLALKLPVLNFLAAFLVKYKRLRSSLATTHSATKETNANKDRSLHNGAAYRDYRAQAKYLVESNCDQIMAVSAATKSALVEHGWNPDKITICQIGNDQADQQDQAFWRNKPLAPVTFAYIGYARKDKGFYFFLEAMKALPAEQARQCNLIIAAETGSPAVMEAISALATKFNCVTFHNGFKRSDLGQMLINVNYGVVPVLWRDNMPQVALEFYCNGCAVIASDLGGAAELSLAKDLRFKAGDVKDFIDVITSAIANPEGLIGNYFTDGVRLPDQQQHVAQLLNFYR